MAKKKKSQRKRNFAYSSSNAPKASSPIVEPAVQEANEAVSTDKPKAKAANFDRLGFLRHDIRMIMILALSCVVLEVVLWFLLQHTSLGHTVFGL